MAFDVNKLVPEFKHKILALLENCKNRGIIMRPYDGLRDPVSQGKLWRQSRSSAEIKAQIAKLRAQHADFLADCIEKSGSQQGRPVTNTIPGFSWHQWGEALDCFWLLNDAAEWSAGKTVNGVNGYQIYAFEAEKIGLTAGGHWSSFKDWPHVQLRKAGNVADVYSVAEIDREMRKRFG